MNRKGKVMWLTGLAALASLSVVACSTAVNTPTADSTGQSTVSLTDYEAVKAQLAAKEAALAAASASQEQQVAKLRSDADALKAQLASIAPSTVVQAGQLAPAPSNAQPTGWDTAESLRGGLTLFAQYDSSGPDAWDVKAHPMVFMTSEGMGYGHRPSKTDVLPGVQVVDAKTDEVVASALYDLGGAPTMTPHGSGSSPDGKWFYIGFTLKVPSGENPTRTLVINARTLKIDKILQHTGGQRLHHVMSFKDWMGRDRVAVEYGFGGNGGPHFLLDPKDNNKVVKAITTEDTGGYKMGHPFLTVDPTGKYLYVQLKVGAWHEVAVKVGGIAKINLEKNTVTVIAGVGEHPIGVVHTSDGKYTYVADGEGSLVYKIDDATNEIVGHTSAGVAGPYGLAFNWDETILFTVGKGEGSHNTGGALGVIDMKSFRPTRNINQPIETGGSVVDHAMLNPDPALNELWVSSAGTFETIVVDLNTYEVKTRIPSAHGGDQHSGAFIRYSSDWAGEVLWDHGGPHKEVSAIMRTKAAAAASAK